MVPGHTMATEARTLSLKPSNGEPNKPINSEKGKRCSFFAPLLAAGYGRRLAPPSALGRLRSIRYEVLTYGVRY
jgi:hypothetical protein